MPKDFLQLPRSAATDELWRNPYAARLYFYLLRKADDNGEWKVSLRQIYADLGLSKRQYHMGLEVLKGASIATSKGSAKTASITICDAANKRTSKIPKMCSNAVPKTTSKFIPPTDEEVAAYVAEKGYHFNPAQFVPHYQSKGWKVGNQPMKDWRAACRTWENSWKEKHGERFYYEIQPIATADNAASRKAQRDRGLSLATEIVARSENLLSLFNGSGNSDSDTCKN